MSKAIPFLLAILLLLPASERLDPTTQVVILGSITRTLNASGEALYNFTIKNTGNASATELRVKFRFYSDAARTQLIQESLWPRNGPTYLMAQEEQELSFWAGIITPQVQGYAGEIDWQNPDETWGTTPFSGN